MGIRKFFNGIHFISAILACIFLAFQLIIISANVILRYFFSSGISWTEEISTNVLMTAFTFLSMAIGVKMDSHINVNLIPKRAPQWITTVLFKLKYLVLSVIGFVLLYYGISAHHGDQRKDCIHPYIACLPAIYHDPPGWCLDPIRLDHEPFGA